MFECRTIDVINAILKWVSIYNVLNLFQSHTLKIIYIFHMCPDAIANEMICVEFIVRTAHTQTLTLNLCVPSLSSSSSSFIVRMKEYVILLYSIEWKPADQTKPNCWTWYETLWTKQTFAKSCDHRPILTHNSLWIAHESHFFPIHNTIFVYILFAFKIENTSSA